MPEVANLPLPRKTLEFGVRDMVRVCDGRMSGTAYGTVVLHVAPEAAAGGPLAWSRTAIRSCWTSRGVCCSWTSPRMSWSDASRRRASPRGSPHRTAAGSACTLTMCNRPTPELTLTSFWARADPAWPGSPIDHHGDRPGPARARRPARWVVRTPTGTPCCRSAWTTCCGLARRGAGRGRGRRRRPRTWVASCLPRSSPRRCGAPASPTSGAATDGSRSRPRATSTSGSTWPGAQRCSSRHTAHAGGRPTDSPSASAPTRRGTRRSPSSVSCSTPPGRSSGT